MYRNTLSTIILAATAVYGSSIVEHQARHDHSDVPSLHVPACPATSTVTYTKSVPSTDEDPFPETQVALCYDDSFIQIVFTALNETSFYCTPNLSAPGYFSRRI